LSSKPAPYDYFAKRQTLVYVANLEDMFLQTKAQQVSGSTDEWMALPFPSEAGSFILAQGPSYAVLATTETKRLAAWLFVRWMSNVDHQGKIVKASGSLPLGRKSVQYAIELEDALPQWAQVADMIDLVKVPPSIAGWNNAEMVMEDVSWQLFRTDYPVEQIPDLVKMMDQTYSELSIDTP
jgi:ABC-type glycerol-3-phosphate transport system substrate-binding protein